MARTSEDADSVGVGGSVVGGSGVGWSGVGWSGVVAGVWFMSTSKRMTEPRECPPRETRPLKGVGCRERNNSYSRFSSPVTVLMMCCGGDAGERGVI